MVKSICNLCLAELLWVPMVARQGTRGQPLLGPIRNHIEVREVSCLATHVQVSYHGIVCGCGPR